MAILKKHQCDHQKYYQNQRTFRQNKEFMFSRFLLTCILSKNKHIKRQF